MPQWVSLLALAALTVAAPSDGTRGISSVVCICAGGHLGLRGGGLAEEQAARERRMAASLGSLRGIASELEGIAREGDDQVVIIPWHLCTRSSCVVCAVILDSLWCGNSAGDHRLHIVGRAHQLTADQCRHL